jgi:hypothetical protein
MATEKKSILARLQAAGTKQLAADAKKRNKVLAAAREALAGLAGVEFLESGKTHLVTLHGAKVAAVNTAIHIFGMVEDKAVHMPVTAKELQEYVKELAARKE